MSVVDRRPAVQHAPNTDTNIPEINVAWEVDEQAYTRVPARGHFPPRIFLTGPLAKQQNVRQ